MATRIQLRRDTSSNWTTADPILGAGELAISTDLEKIKIGDGTSSWSTLNYFNLTPTEVQSAIDSAIAAVVDNAPALLDTLNELAAAINDDPTFFTTVATNLSNHEADTTNIHGIANTADLVVNSDLSVYAPLDSPSLTGTPTAPTATSGTNTTQIATTEYVQTEISGVSSLPSQAGHSGEYLTTDGSTAYWNAIQIEPTIHPMFIIGGV